MQGSRLVRGVYDEVRELLLGNLALFIVDSLLLYTERCRLLLASLAPHAFSRPLWPLLHFLWPPLQLLPCIEPLQESYVG